MQCVHDREPSGLPCGRGGIDGVSVDDIDRESCRVGGDGAAMVCCLWACR